MNVNYRVVGLDPGGTTGVFQYDAEFMPPLDLKGPGELIDEQIRHFHFGPKDHHEELYEFLEMSHIHNYHLVYESFEFRNDEKRFRDNINLMSREYIGVAKLFAMQRHLFRDRRVFAYNAGMSKGFIPDKAKNGLAANAKLKAIPGFYVPGWKHANDAARVTAYFLINHERRTDLIQGWKDLV